MRRDERKFQKVFLSIYPFALKRSPDTLPRSLYIRPNGSTSAVASHHITSSPATVNLLSDSPETKQVGRT
ncbi:hypothetical protein QVD17_24880 [Tagetes erecta]|uniref:Uncharacterized protein n=1 Tax=Tagetes erecta TaxID=13708 RepID=A0AAD8KFV7_TARER|nr:hypothetical protein QVD17_24880 [Tagetes erecta]